jgi:LDH2 family malate/lactate/ureidoglycolate dehydrogenase
MTSENTTAVPADQLRNYCQQLLQKAGVPADEASIVAEILVEADLAGIESHGTSRMPVYLKKLRIGGVSPVLQLKAITDGPGTGVFDAGNGLGAVAGHRAMGMVIEKAKKVGLSLITVKNSNHYGAAAYFAKMALPHDMVGFTATNAVSTMAPWGGYVPYFGTNPFAVAIPAGRELPIVADMATSVVARGKIRLAAKKGQSIPLGWAVTKDGEDTTDPEAALNGIVLPFGGPKGSAIATLIESLTGILAGSVFGTQISSLYQFETPSRVSHCFAAIDLAAFGPVEDFKKRIDQMIREIKSGPKAKNVAEIFLPGEIEARKRHERVKTGIPISRPVLNELRQEGVTSGVPYILE